MGKATKIILAVVVVLIAVFVGLLILAQVLITPERVRATVVPMAEEALERKVSLGEIKVSLFSGIELHDLRISEQEGDEAFIASDLVRLRYQLLPLLALQVVIDEVRIDRPQIRIERYHDGSYNFSDLMAEPSETAAAAEQGSEPMSPPAVGPLNLLVTEVRIENGQMLFFDHLVEGQAPYRHAVTDLQFGAKGIVFDRAVPVTLSGRLNGSTMDVTGSIELAPLSVRADVSLTDLDALQFKHYFVDLLPGDLNGLKLSLETSLESSDTGISAIGRLSAADLDLTLDAMPDAPLQLARIGLDYNVSLASSGNVVTINRFNTDFNGIRLEATGQIDGLQTIPRADLKVTIPALDLRQAVKALPAGLLGPAVADLDPAGSLQGELTLVGTFDQPQALLREASLTFNKLQATAGGQRPSLDGRLLLDGDRLRSENLVLGLGDNRAELQLAASNLFDPPIVVRADVTSERFQLDPLLQGGAASVGAGASAGDQAETATGTATESAASAGELGPFDIPVRAEGEIRIGETTWKGMVIQDFIAMYTLRDNVLTVSRMDGQVAEGSFSNTARVDLGRKGLAYSADIDLNAIQANPLLTAFVPAAADSLLGQLDLKLAVQGAGTEWTVARERLSGQGDLAIANGKLVNPALVRGLANVLQLPNLNELVFDTFTGNLRIKDGNLLLDSKINSSRIKLFPTGRIGLGGDLALDLDTRLSPEVSARLDSSSKLTQYLQDEQGWTQLPLKLSGDFSSPKFGLDSKALQKGATRAIQQEIEKRLGEKLLGTPKSDNGTGDTQQQEEDPASRLLKGLFGQ